MISKEIINEYGIEFAIEKIAQKISNTVEEYNKTKDERIKKQIIELIKDREEIYNNNKQIIEKYLKN